MLMFAFYGAWTAAQELFWTREYSEALTSEEPLAAPPGWGISVSAQYEVLSRCESQLQTPGAAATPEKVQRCRAVADDVTSKFPSYSYGWAVLAIAAANQKDWPQFNVALVRARATGPFESWVAVRRWTTAEQNFDELDGLAKAAADQDLAMLLSSSLGRKYVAAKYAEAPDLRDRITAAVNLLPSSAQRQFLGSVRNAMR